MVAYVHIEYPAYQFSEESKGGGGIHPPPGPCGTEKSVVLRGLKLNSRGSKLKTVDLKMCDQEPSGWPQRGSAGTVDTLVPILVYF